MSDLIVPHGGLQEPINRNVPAEEAADFRARAASLPRVVVSEADLSTLYRLGDGGLSPLTGPMDREAFQRVLDEEVIVHDGKKYAWTIPLSFPIEEEQAKTLKAGQTVALVNPRNELVGSLEIRDVFPWDKAHYVRGVYGTERFDHPGGRMTERDSRTHLLGGEVRVLPHPKNPEYGRVKDGSFGANEMYAHALAARTLCDAYALTKDDKWKGPAQKALDFVVEAQDPVGGGWRYQPKQPGDLSVTGWQFAALKRGQLAGLVVPRNTWKMAEKFFDICEIAPGGEFSYTPGAGASPSMTAVGLLCRQYTGVGPKNPSLQKGVRNLKAHPPGMTGNLYYLYYANQVMYNFQGDIWRSWDTGVSAEGERIHPGMRNWLLNQQDKGDGTGHPHQMGSWSGSQGGRIMATSLSLLILEQVKRQPLNRHKAAIGE